MALRRPDPVPAAPPRGRVQLRVPRAAHGEQVAAVVLREPGPGHRVRARAALFLVGEHLVKGGPGGQGRRGRAQRPGPDRRREGGVAVPHGRGHARAAVEGRAAGGAVLPGPRPCAGV